MFNITQRSQQKKKNQKRRVSCVCGTLRYKVLSFIVPRACSTALYSCENFAWFTPSLPPAGPGRDRAGSGRYRSTNAFIHMRYMNLSKRNWKSLFNLCLSIVNTPRMFAIYITIFFSRKCISLLSKYSNIMLFFTLP